MTLAERFEGGRWRFLLGPGVTCTMDVDAVKDGWAQGTLHNLTTSHSADRAEHGQPVMVQLSQVLTAKDLSES